ncbi:hypothetical protein P280DRAFT_505480 [Massarina eburnea CBS 473.64]|uniref:DUF8004 domain-containing protein n=1 Tax=Massarina eburnea CBS 473.64 TaxID=1395130 RepID=A0A6A6S9A7_9PLEO|nr:hypothetical protein P280DRAFT_505480 [Massarina eburnea CBS 473.64]
MSLGWSASRVDEKPRSLHRSIVSRKSSIANPCPAPSGHAGHTSSVSTKSLDQVSDASPSLSWGSKESSRRQRPQSLIIENVSSLGFLKDDPADRLSRSQSSRVFAGSTMSRRSASCSTPMRTPMRAANVRRWEGQTRTVSDWDGLRRDPELWFEDGDCLVHLYSRGQSRRGPSFCVPFSTLTQFNCGSMFSLCFAQITETPGADIRNPRRISNTFTTKITGQNKVELFIPAPDDATREDAFQWHITTRNFFAYIFGKPLVGEQLGQSLVDLQERMHLFRSGRINNYLDFLTYADSQGYRAFAHYPDYALAILYYAEHYKLRDVWIDAFAHCVGMNEILATSPEFTPLSSLTKALITRAYLEMDIQLGRVTSAVRDFLADDVSPAYLGLSDGARTHVDRFRSFLHEFYVGKFGYWPPPKGLCFPKAMFKSLYNDFKCLYDYLVDEESNPDISSQKPASGGICVLQNIESFDNRHRFPSLSHPLPLLPNDVPLRSRIESQRCLRALTLGSKQAKTDRFLTARAALTAATNEKDVTVSNSPVVQAYKRFERQWAQNPREEKVSMADARKVRWILIYGTLQYLVSALRAPKEVRDTTTPSYPLCCLVTEQSAWQDGTARTKASTSSETQSSDNVPKAINDYLSASGSMPDANILIQPDCQTQEYFTHTNTNHSSRPISVEIPAPLKISQPARNTSIRSLKRLTMSRSRSSSRRSSVQLKSTSHYDSLVHGYGNEPNEIVATSASQTLPRSQPSGNISFESLSRTTSPNVIKFPDRTQSRHLELKCKLPSETHPTPMFASDQIAKLADAGSSEAFPVPSSANSATSMNSPTWSDGASSISSKSSIYSQAELCVQPLNTYRYGVVELGGGPLGGLVSINDASIMNPGISAQSPRSTSPTTPPITHGEFNFGFESPIPALANPRLFHSVNLESTVGVAISALQPTRALITHPKTSMSSDHLPLFLKKKSHSRTTSDESCPSLSAKSLRSISIESLRVVAAVEAMSPLRSGSPSRKPSQKSTTIDSAPHYNPDEFNAEKKEDKASTRTTTGMSETSRSILEAIPPPITMTIPYSLGGAQVKTIPYHSTQSPEAKSVEAPAKEAKSIKKSRRRSFWRR